MDSEPGAYLNTQEPLSGDSSPIQHHVRTQLYDSASGLLGRFLDAEQVAEPEVGDLDEWLEQVENDRAALLEENQQLRERLAKLNKRWTSTMGLVKSMAQDNELYSRSLAELSRYRLSELRNIEYGI